MSFLAVSFNIIYLSGEITALDIGSVHVESFLVDVETCSLDMTSSDRLSDACTVFVAWIVVDSYPYTVGFLGSWYIDWYLKRKGAFDYLEFSQMIH